MPDDFGIAVAIADVRHDGIAGEPPPGASAIGGGGDMLGKRRGRRKEQHRRWQLGFSRQFRNGLPRHHRGAGVTLAGAIGKQSDGPFFPMHQIFACRMPPVHVESARTAGARGIGLIKNMVEAVLVIAAVDVVHPAQARAEMKTGTQRTVAGIRFNNLRVTQLEPFKDIGVCRSEVEGDILAAKLANIVGIPKVRRPVLWRNLKMNIA